MSTLGRVAAALISAATFVAVTPAQEHGKPAGDKPAAGAPQKPAAVFVIVKSGDKLEVMNKEAVEAKNKQFAADFEKAKAQYDKDKQAAEAAHKPFDGKAPTKQVMETTGGDFASKEAADAAMKKMADDKAKADKEKAEKEKAAKDKEGKDKKGGEKGKDTKHRQGR
jgi:uncharacterized spore protein YtfJ